MKKILFTVFLALIVVKGCKNQTEKSQTDSLTTEVKSNKMDKDQLTNFGKKYANAWCSQKPESVAAFFTSNGSLKVNAGEPAIGREAITGVAQGFMTAFPDMIVTMDSLVTKPNGIEFHWTLTGTNSAEGGTGNKVRISGFELWQIDNDGFISESKGIFDEVAYNNQLKHGLN